MLRIPACCAASCGCTPGRARRAPPRRAPRARRPDEGRWGRARSRPDGREPSLARAQRRALESLFRPSSRARATSAARIPSSRARSSLSRRSSSITARAPRRSASSRAGLGPRTRSAASDARAALCHAPCPRARSSAISDSREKVVRNHGARPMDLQQHALFADVGRSDRSCATKPCPVRAMRVISVVIHGRPSRAWDLPGQGTGVGPCARSFGCVATRHFHPPRFGMGGFTSMDPLVEELSEGAGDLVPRASPDRRTRRARAASASRGGHREARKRSLSRSTPKRMDRPHTRECAEGAPAPRRAGTTHLDGIRHGTIKLNFPGSRSMGLASSASPISAVARSSSSALRTSRTNA